PAEHFENPLHAAPQHAATGGDRGGESHLLTVHEVARLLQVPVSWVYGRMRKRSRDRLPGYRLGKYWRFSEDEILAWVKRQRGDGHAA
ncbi:MAG TPA: helix-turn-helix domain-containing protein, partial [Candidatus Acidoferrum sp.]|nr:helix-turn-helix domain-containing protein [Candidatus Acidoferrum sp.]